jgi:hypothetical protein
LGQYTNLPVFASATLLSLTPGLIQSMPDRRAVLSSVVLHEGGSAKAGLPSIARSATEGQAKSSYFPAMIFPFLSALQAVRTALFREDFYSALSAPLRAPREKGNLVAASRAAFFAFFAVKIFLKLHAPLLKVPLSSQTL